MKKLLLLVIITAGSILNAQFSSEDDYTEDANRIFSKERYKNGFGFGFDFADNSLDWSVSTANDKLSASSDLTGLGLFLSYRKTLLPGFYISNKAGITSLEKITAFSWYTWQNKVSDIPTTYNDHYFYNLLFGLEKYKLELSLDFSYEDMSLGSTADMTGNTVSLNINHRYEFKTMPVITGFCYSYLSNGYTKNSGILGNLMKLKPLVSLKLATEYDLIRGKIAFAYNFRQYHDDIYNGEMINNFDFSYIFNFPNVSLDFLVNGGYNFSKGFKEHSELLPKYYYSFMIRNNFMKNKIQLSIIYSDEAFSRSINQDVVLHQAIISDASENQNAAYKTIEDYKEDFDTSVLKITVDYLF